MKDREYGLRFERMNQWIKHTFLLGSREEDRILRYWFHCTFPLEIRCYHTIPGTQCGNN